MTHPNPDPHNWTYSSAAPRFDRDRLVCPRCGDRTTHLTQSIVHSAPDGTGLRETTTTRRDGEVVGAGGYPFAVNEERCTFALVGFCESDCEFVISFRQRSGSTYASIHHRQDPQGGRSYLELSEAPSGADGSWDS